MSEVVIDTNLLVLLVVGLGDESDIDQNRACYPKYSKEHFTILSELISKFSKIIVTPHCLAETSNLLDKTNGERQIRARISFKKLISTAIEIHTEANKLVEEDEFDWLGLSDVSQIIATSDNRTLLSADGQLCEAALRRGLNTINFWHEWESRVGV